MILPATPQASYRLTPAQQRMWIESHFEKMNAGHNQIFAVQLDGELDPTIFQGAVHALVDCHESLRTTFGMVDGVPRQYVHDAEKVDPLIAASVTKISGDFNNIEQLIRQEACFDFDLSQFPLFHIKLIGINSKQHICIFNLHAIICDEVSKELLLRDFCRFYGGGTAGNVAVGAAAVQVKDYAEWLCQSGGRTCLAKQEAYWVNSAKNWEKTLPLPVDRPHPPGQLLAGNQYVFRFDTQQTGALRQVAHNHKVTLDTVLLAVYCILLSKIGNQDAVTVATPVTNRRMSGMELLVGLLENTVLIYTGPIPGLQFRALLTLIQQKVTEAWDYQEYPYESLRSRLAVRQSDLQDPVSNATFRMDCETHMQYEAGKLTVTPYPCSLKASLADLNVRIIVQDNELSVVFAYSADLFDQETIVRFTTYFQTIADVVVNDPSVRIGTIEVMDEQERSQLLPDPDVTLNGQGQEVNFLQLFEQQAQRIPGRMAVVDAGGGITFQELNEQANQLAHCLRDDYLVGPGDRVAIIGERSITTIAGLLGILKAGGAYVAINPAAPTEKIEYLLNDSGATLLVQATEFSEGFACDVNVLPMDRISESNSLNPVPLNAPDDLFCLVYPNDGPEAGRGVMISHTGVIHLLKGMNRALAHGPDACLLAVADPWEGNALIELFWTLCNGLEVVLHPPASAVQSLDRYTLEEDLKMDFSLFFFANYNLQADDKYRLLLDAVQYADREGFQGVWIPERHFHEFGALFPNPSVINAALAMITKRLELRSGSIISPLHDAVRIAEEWSVVDNLSKGRAALSFAPGWNVNDFALASHDYNDRHRIMHEQIETVKRLWQGESIKRENGLKKEIEIHTFPAPIRRELPIWLTAAGNEKTFIAAGEQGANLLTHLLGQDMEDLSRKIKLYRQARRRSGYDEATGKVAVMLHTYVGNDINEVEKIVEIPFTNYLKSAIGLSKILYEEAGLQDDEIPEADKEIMLKHSFQRYYKSSALIGDYSSCTAMIKKLKGIGVDEIACLVDFGIEHSRVMAGLKNLSALQALFLDQRQRIHHPITMLQVPPSVAAHIADDPGSTQFLASLQVLLFPGTKVPASLVLQLGKHGRARLLQLYGHAEATIVSAIHEENEQRGTSVVGQCLEDTHIYVLNRELQLLPVGVEGEIYIGGKGVASGYWHQPELTEKQFIVSPFAAGEWLFRTGNFGKRLSNGDIKLIPRQTSGIGRSRTKDATKFAAPTSETEGKLVELWAGILGIDRKSICVDRSFFGLGGDSLKSIALQHKLYKAFAVHISLTEIWKNPTVQHLAELLTNRGIRNYPLIPKVHVQEHYPVSFAQQRLYDVLTNIGGAFNNYTTVYQINETPDVDKLRYAFQALMLRHQGLRTRFLWSTGTLRQQITDEASARLTVLDANQYSTMQEAIKAFERPFNLSEPPLIRCGLLKSVGLGNWLLVDIHPIICDKVSLNILINDLQHIYEGCDLAPLNLQYVDYASWQRDPINLAKKKAFWSDKLGEEVLKMDLPVVQEREPMTVHQVAKRSVEVGDTLLRKHNELRLTTNISDAAILLSAYFILLARMTGQTNLVVGIEVDGRPQQSLKYLVSPFDNILPFRVHFPNGGDYQTFLANIEENFQEVLDYQDFPYDQMLPLVSDGEQHGIVDVYFLYARSVEFKAKRRGLEFMPYPREELEEERNYEFGIEVIESEDKLAVHLVYDKQLYDSDTIELLSKYYLNILHTVLDNQYIDINSIELGNSKNILTS